jgi:ADP-ribosylglycohydrolase
MIFLDRPAPAEVDSSLPVRTLAAGVYLDKVLGAWTGKFIGGTLGAPVEGVKEAHDFSAVATVPPAMMENDDTDLQLLWLHALQEHGLGLGPDELISEWREHALTPWGEYGVARANWDRGIRPPDSGRVNNWFYSEGMGCPIRAEIWGLICPGAPVQAARYAEMDAQVDHAGNAVEAEKFCAAIVAAAFFEADTARLVNLGLGFVDPDSRFAAMVRDVQEWVKCGDWRTVRARILRQYGHPEMTHCMQNLGFIVLALLMGKGEFLETMFMALNCGFDSDCTAATAGAVLGTVLGFKAMPQAWTQATGDRYVVSACMHGFPRYGSIVELSRACCALGEAAANLFATGVVIGPSGETPPPPLAVVPQVVPPVRQQEKPFATWRVVGPFWRNWDECREQDFSLNEHGLPTLPSVAYMSHCQSGMDREFLDAAMFDFAAPTPRDSEQWVRAAGDSRLPLDNLDSWDGPAVIYAVTEFTLHSPRDTSWLMIGCTGPYRAWLDGREVGASATYQRMSPHNFAIPVSMSAGRHRLVLKLERTSQPLGASVAFKRHDGKHWHQCFFDDAIEWVDWGSRSETIA